MNIKVFFWPSRVKFSSIFYRQRSGFFNWSGLVCLQNYDYASNIAEKNYNKKKGMTSRRAKRTERNNQFILKVKLNFILNIHSWCKMWHHNKPYTPGWGNHAGWRTSALAAPWIRPRSRRRECRAAWRLPRLRHHHLPPRSHPPLLLLDMKLANFGVQFRGFLSIDKMLDIYKYYNARILILTFFAQINLTGWIRIQGNI